MKNKKIAIFDLDHCLLELNTSFEFVKYILLSEKKYLSLILLNIIKFTIPLLNFVYPKLTDREIYLRFLKDINYEVIKFYAEKFAEYSLNDKFLNEPLYNEYFIWHLIFFFKKAYLSKMNKITYVSLPKIFLFFTLTISIMVLVIKQIISFTDARNIIVMSFLLSFNDFMALMKFLLKTKK